MDAWSRKYTWDKATRREWQPQRPSEAACPRPPPPGAHPAPPPCTPSCPGTTESGQCLHVHPRTVGPKRGGHTGEGLGAYGVRGPASPSHYVRQGKNRVTGAEHVTLCLRVNRKHVQKGQGPDFNTEYCNQGAGIAGDFQFFSLNT